MNCKFRPMIKLAFHIDFSVMFRDNAIDLGQADSRTVRLGGKVQVVYSGYILVGNANTGISDFDGQGLLRTAGADIDPAVMVDSVDGIFN